MRAQFGIAEGYARQVSKAKQDRKSSFRLKSYGIIFYFSFTYPFILTSDLPYFVLQKDYLFKELWKN